MVLKSVLALILGVSAVAKAADPTDLDRASVAVQAALRAHEWSQAERIADGALRTSWPGWPPSDVTQPEVVKKLKSKPRLFFNILKGAIEAKSQRFMSLSSDLSEAERAKRKGEIKLNTDALEAAGGTKSAETYWARLQDHEDLTAKEEYKFSLAMALSYWTWEDRRDFDNFRSAHSLLYTPCLGMSLDYINAFFDWSGGGCVGVGRGDVRFNDGYLDNHGSLTMLSGFVSGLVQLSDAGAAFGLESDLLDLTVTGKASNGTRVVSNNQQFAVLAVGRFRFGRLDVKFKGGSIIDNPSAVWTVELAYPLYRFL